MNVKHLLIFSSLLFLAILNDDSSEDEPSLQIEIPFGNPYKEQLDTIHAELIEVYDIVKACVIQFLMDVPLASGKEIEANCVGPNFSIINHIFLLKSKKAMNFYDKGLNERFEEAYETYPDEIAHFISLYKMFHEKGFYSIFETMQLAKNGSKYFVQPDIYDSLLELSKDMLNIIGSFSRLLAKERKDIKEFIKEKLLNRDENLKVLLRLDRGDETESEAHANVIDEENTQPMTLSQKISQMDKKIKEETENIENGNVMNEDDKSSIGKSGLNKYTPFEENIESIEDPDSALKNLQKEFVPEAIEEPRPNYNKNIKENEDDEKNYTVKESDEIPEATDPRFSDELDFWYDRNKTIS